MTMPIPANCRACGRQLLLREVVRAGSGACPTCGEMLTRDYSFMMIDDARRAEALAGELAVSLQRLVGLNGNLRLDRTAIFEAIAAVVPSEAADRTHREHVVQEGRRLRRAVWSWQRTNQPERQRLTRRLLARLSTLAQRARSIASTTPADGQGLELLAAADAVSNAAQRMGAERVHSALEAAAALDRVGVLLEDPQDATTVDVRATPAADLAKVG